MAATFFTAVLSFASTNIDDIFVLMILYAQVKNARGIAQIVAGQYAGIGLLVALGMMGALGTQLFPPRYIGLLGFLPLFLGVRAWVSYRRGGEGDGEKKETQPRFFSVCLLTMANGADNIGVYIPVFSGYTLAEMLVTSAVFAGMIALWCCLGYVLASRPYVKQRITRYQHVLVPAVLIALGLMILVENAL